MSSSRPFIRGFSRFAPRYPAGLLLVALLASCAADQVGQEHEEVRKAILYGEFNQGLKLTNELLAGDPEDPELKELHRVALTAYYLDMGRDATFADRDEEALEWFAKADELSPETDHGSQWIIKTKNKLANDLLGRGNTRFTEQDYKGAAEDFRRILVLVPGHATAISGLAEVTRVLNYRTGLGEGAYDTGVRSLATYRLRRAWREFSVTSLYLPRLERAYERGTETSILLAEQSVDMARLYEADGLYAAAHNEYGFALELNPDNADAKESMPRLAKEAQAANVLREVQMLIYRRRFDEALKRIDEGSQLTELQTEAFLRSRDEIEQARFDAAYQIALNYEYDGEYEKAVQAFDELIDIAEYYKDAMARKSTLKGYIELAAGYYQKALDEDDLEIRLQHYLSIETFWPDYKDVTKHIADTRKRIARSKN